MRCVTAKSVTFAVLAAAQLPFVSAAEGSIPDYVTQYAPLVHLDVNEPYLPSDIGSQVTNTYPELNFTRVRNTLFPRTIDSLASINDLGNCTVDEFDECPLYLTVQTNISTRPDWLYGVLPNTVTGETVGAKSCAVVVRDHNDGTVDAFYFYFYAFNLGLNISGTYLGNHVGDWEHSMVRFVNGKPSTVYYSAHDAGFVYTYDAVSKNNSRPLVYASLGGHANYPTPGLQVRHVGGATLNDTTSTGPLWDPVANAYFYAFVANSSSDYNGTFTPAIAPNSSNTTLPPVDWLYYLGRWGDKQYPDSNPIQVNVANISWAYEDGPTGPLDKVLVRNGSCPKDPCTTTSSLPSIVGATAPVQTVTRVGGAAGGAAATSASTASSSGTGGSGSGTSSAPSAAKTNSASTNIHVPGYLFVGVLIFWLPYM